MPFVLDASAAVPWCFRDEQTAATQMLLQRSTAGEQAVVPDHFTVELLNVLLHGVKRGRVTRTDVERFWAAVAQLTIKIDRQTASTSFPIFELAARHRLTAYDAAYLELAIRRGLPLATLDTDLATAARAEDIELLL